MPHPEACSDASQDLILVPNCTFKTNLSRVANAAHDLSREELADLVWLRTGKAPTHVRCQALLVVAEFDDGTTSVHRVESLVAQ